MYDESLIPILPFAIKSIADGDRSIIDTLASEAIPFAAAQHEAMTAAVTCADRGRLLEPDTVEPYLAEHLEMGALVTILVPETSCAGWDVEPNPPESNELLTETDVPEILDLVERAQPGPFAKRTHELGRYLGIRHEGRLVAMAGERFRLPGWTEVSAVCTDPAFRERGLGARLTLAVAAGILDRGDLPFLHVQETNTAAIRLYEAQDDFWSSQGLRLYLLVYPTPQTIIVPHHHSQ